MRRPARPRLLAITVASALSLIAPTAFAQDWDVGPSRPSRPSRPARPSRPSRPSRPPSPAPPSVPGLVAPNSPAPDTSRSQRTIEHLLTTLLRATDENAVALPTLLRLVRERDGSLDALTADLEARARADSADAVGATLLLGHIQRQNGRLDEALTHYTRASSLAPNNPVTFIAAADTLRQLDRSAQALYFYEHALTLNGAADRRKDILRAIIDLSLATHDLARARVTHQRLVAASPDRATVRRELADALMTRRMFPEAIVEYQSLARALAGDNRVLPPVLRDLGRAQMQAGLHDDALATLRRALSLAGADAGIRRELLDDMTELRTRRHELDDWVRELTRQGAPTWERQMLLGRLHAEQGHTDEAVAAYRRASALRPADIDALVQLAQLLAQGARLEELVAVRRRLAEVAPRNPTYVTELADELVRSGRRAEALQVLARASARAGDAADVHERLAEVYARLGERALALHETELVARYDPSDPAALEALGERLLDQGDRARALATWQRIRDNARDRARGAAALAEVYGRHDMAPQAMELYREAIALRPDDVDFHKGLAVLEEGARMFDPAIGSWRRVIALSRDSRELRREARSRIVNLWNLQGTLASHLHELQQLFEATPPDLEAGRDLAEVFVRLRRLEEADRVLARLVEADPADVTTLSALERLRTQRGDLSGAVDVLRRLTVADPRHARDWYQRMATHSLALHRDAEAIESAARAVELNPDDANGHLRLGELYRAQNQAPQAAASFRRALALNDRLFSTYFELADLYLSRDEAREALTLYRRVLRLAPDDDLVTRAGRMAVQIAPAADAVAELERDLSAAASASPSRTVLRRLLVDLYAATCRPLIHTLRHGAPADAARARTALSQMGTRALKSLLDTLSDGDISRQRVALEILGYLGNPNASPALLAVAEGEGPREIRVGALRAAASVADARALPRLIALTRNADPSIASLAVWGVGRVRTPAATAQLLRIVAQGGEGDAAAMAALQLPGARIPAVRAALIGALDFPSDRLPAAAMLALAPTADAAVVARLRAALLGGEWSRAAALTALGTIPDPSEAVLDDIARALFSPMVLRLQVGEVALRRVAARALVRLATRDDSARRQIMTDPEPAADAGATLLRLFDPPGVALNGEEALVRYASVIARAAGESLATPQGIDRVLDALSVEGSFGPLTGDARAVSPAATAAARSIVRAVTPALAALVTHPPSDVNTRRRLLRVLATSDAPDAMEAIARAVEESDIDVSETALGLLARRRGEGARAPSIAIQHLDPASPWKARLSAVVALEGSDAPEVTDALVRALNADPLSMIRAAAARSLARRARDASVGVALEEAARSDVDASVRSAATEALRGR